MDFGALGGWAGIFHGWAVKYGYAGIFAATVLEGLGLPIPVEIPFVVAGLLMTQGKMSFLVVWMIATTGEVLGNLGGYWVGCRGGRALVDRYGRRLGVTDKELSKVASYFDRYGGATIIVARWFGIIRTPTIIAAGLGKMRLDAYTFYSLIAEASWTAGWLWLSYAFSGHYEAVINLIKPHLAWAITLAVFVIAGAWWWTIRNVRR